MDTTQRTQQPGQATTSTTSTSTQASAEATLVADHLPLVHHVVHDLLGRLPQHVSRDDLVSAGMLGLAQAARTYNPTHGVPFDRHAANRIRGAILDELRAIDWASRSVRANARRLAAADETLTARLGRTPTPGELAAELGIARAEVDKLLADVHRATVLNYESVIADGDAEDLLPTDEATPDQLLLGREQQAYLRDAIAALPERLRTVVIGYFYQERPMQELAAELGVTERVVFDTLDREELAARYEAADVFVFPSRTDTFGLVLLEAMACGTPVAAYPVTGPIDVVKPGVTGVLDEDLKTAALAALALDRDAVRREAESWTWERASAQFLGHVVPARVVRSVAVPAS
jgi:RNA polymerase sigma factor for flagellar operon FliA